MNVNEGEHVENTYQAHSAQLLQSSSSALYSKTPNVQDASDDRKRQAQQAPISCCLWGVQARQAGLGQQHQETRAQRAA